MKLSFLVSLLRNIMEPAKSVKNLGDADNLIQRHMANSCHVSHYYFREPRRVHRYLSQENSYEDGKCLSKQSPRLMHFTALSQKTAYIRRVQNDLCCTMCKLNKFSPVTPFLQNYTCFPFSILLFKYKLLTDKEINFCQPPNLFS